MRRWKNPPTSPAAAIDLSSLTDGLRAEREQGITTDVPYRYFATPKRKFINEPTRRAMCSAPHDMAKTSTANLSIALVDARP